MFLLNKHIKNDKAFTLVEILACLVLLSIISIFIIPLITNSIETTREIQQDTNTRDEADLIMSKFIKTLYSTKQTNIIRNITDSNGNSYLDISNDITKCSKNVDGTWNLNTDCVDTLEPLGFKTVAGNTKIHFKNEEYTISNNNIKISSNSKIKGDPNSVDIYEISLYLELTNTRDKNSVPQELEFKNQIQPILPKSN